MFLHFFSGPFDLVILSTHDNNQKKLLACLERKKSKQQQQHIALKKATQMYNIRAHYE